MFHSATVRLTAWYLLILMSISLLFSITVYEVATIEVRDRLRHFQNQFEAPGINSSEAPNHRLYSALRQRLHETANHNLFITLVYVNLLVLIGGGALSYVLARRTLNNIEHAHDTQSRFTSDASHELRTPLAAMKAELELALQNPKLSKADMRELLESNLEEVNKLTALSQTLLSLSKLDHAKLDFEPVDLATTASEVAQRYDRNQRRISLDIPKDPLTISANRAALEQLLTILVDNALKYSPAESKISATLSRRGRHAVFRITNYGKGIPTEKLPYIFERFYRADESRTAAGTGLGLALAKEIVAIHKGELSVSSTPEKETTFEFLLPLARSR